MAPRNDWVAHLIRYKLPELRRRQRLIESQISRAHSLASNQGTSERGLIALTSLQEMSDSLVEAIALRYCGTERE